MINDAFRERVAFSSDGMTRLPERAKPPRAGRFYVYVFEDSPGPGGYPDHRAHAFQIVQVLRSLGTTEKGGQRWEIRADDGWKGEAGSRELLDFDATVDLELPEGLVIETDEDGQTQEGSIAIKRSFIDEFEADGFRDVRELPERHRTLARFFPAEFGEVCEEFERNPGRAFR